MASFVSAEDLKRFHGIDRRLFTRLHINLGYDRTLSMKIIALWLWMEVVGFPGIIPLLLQSTCSVLHAAVFEANNVIEYMEEAYAPRMDVLHVTSNLIRTLVERQYFHENKENALNAIWKTVTEVFSIAFNDIVHGSTSTAGTASTSTSTDNGTTSGGAATVAPNERTMFVTFDRENRVTEEEITQFFTSKYGDCIERVEMQGVPPANESFLAVAHFRNAATIKEFLDRDPSTVGCTVNGKFVYMRKF